MPARHTPPGGRAGLLPAGGGRWDQPADLAPARCGGLDHQLHRVLQAAFGWSGEHLHCFTVRGVDYRAYQGEGLPDGKDADGVTLAALGLRVAERFSYDYAFFSNLTSWRHDIRVQAIAPPRTRQRLPWCAGGARGAPPEDCGGPQVFVAQRQEHSAWQATVRLAELMKRCARCWAKTPSTSYPRCCIGPASTVSTRPR
jgi:hypothetical protein